MLISSAANFESPEGLYWNPNPPPGVPPGYRRYPFFADRIESLKRHSPPKGQKLLIVGCGWGYLVDEALKAGYEAWGCDVSAYAINKHPDDISAQTIDRLTIGDITNGPSMEAVKLFARLTPGQKFDLLVTEDVIECLTDTEIASALPILRGACQTNLFHIITLLDPEPGAKPDPRVNWKTSAEWKRLLTPPDEVVDAHGNVI